MIDENGERTNKVDYQIRKWSERGVLKYVQDWVLGAWGQGYQKATIIKCLDEQGLLENTLSTTERSQLADTLINGKPKVNKNNIQDVISGVLIDGLLKGDKRMTELWIDLSKAKLRERFGLAVEDKKNEGVNITINTGEALDRIGIIDLTSPINFGDGESLSNTDSYDPLEALKGDPAYDRLRQDIEDEKDR